MTVKYLPRKRSEGKNRGQLLETSRQSQLILSSISTISTIDPIGIVFRFQLPYYQEHNITKIVEYISHKCVASFLATTTCTSTPYYIFNR